MSVLLQETDRLIQEDHGGAHGIEKIEKAIRVSKTEIFLYGEKVSTKVAQNALIPMRKSMREDGMDADVVLLAGGGAEAYQNAVKELFTKSRIVLPNESVASNARAFGSAADREEVIVDDSKWDGKISNLNISEQAFPELYRELYQMQHKARSDRLRALALLGIYSLLFSGNIGAFEQQGSESQPAQRQNPSVQADAKLNSQRDSLKGKLMRSV